MRPTALAALLFVVPAVGRAATPAPASAAPALAPAAARQAGFQALLQRYWDRHLESFPELATYIGDPRFHDKLTDLSPQAVAARVAENERFLAEARAIDPLGFSEQDALTHSLLLAQLQDDIDASKLGFDDLAASQMDGPHLDFGVLVGLLPFETRKDCEDYLARVKAFPAQLDQATQLMRGGIQSGRVQPRYIIEKMIAQVAAISKDGLEKSAFAEPLSRLPKSLTAADRARLQKALRAAIETGVLPAYARFEKFLTQEYLPHGRAEPGLWSLPNGVALYANRVQHYTSLRLEPEQIHQLGLSEVARIEAEMATLAKAAGQPDLAHYRAALHAHPPALVTDAASAMKRFGEHIAAMKVKLPLLFGRLPRAGLEVLPVEAFREKDAPSAEYNPGTPDGTRPGHVMIKAGAWLGEDALSLEATAYHEGVPGHHMQLSIAQELPALPPFRQHADYGAYVEGWALYAEGLGKEVGFYTDAASDFGRLDSELFRAVRLVVDTGMHAKHWTRQQALDYLLAHASGSAEGFGVEIDRYVVWAGQALGYKLGQLKIRELRAKAEKALGPKFDLRAFHDGVLGAGPLPLDVLGVRMDAWIAKRLAAR
jgi:uncharacterized protein (DUF885 family)